MRIRKIRHQEIFSLAPKDASDRITIYAGSRTQLMERIRECEQSLTAHPSPSLTRAVRTIRTFVSSLKWPGSQSSLGLFYHPKGAAYAELPFRADSVTVISDSFHIKPILKWIQRDRPFLLLAIAVEDGLIYEGTATRLRRLPMPSSGSAASAGGPWRTLAAQVNELALHSGRPVVLMGPPRIARRLSALLDHLECVVGPYPSDLDYVTLADIHQAALTALEPYWKKRDARCVQDFERAKSRRRTSENLSEIQKLANQGRVAHLMIDERLMVWSSQQGRRIHPLSERPARGDDLLDDVAEKVLSMGGQVTLLSRDQMPDHHAAAAIIRLKTPNERKEKDAKLTYSTVRA